MPAEAGGAVKATCTITVELVEDQADGEIFMQDICEMMEHIAKRSGVVLHLERCSTASRVYRLHEADFPAALIQEVGVHRAQVVPRGSPVGRIVTCTVRVLISGASDEDSHAVIKTYNYPQRRVAVHASGALVPLDRVLAGQADEGPV